MNGTAHELNLPVDAGTSGAALLARLGRVGIGTGFVIAVGLGIFGRFSGLGSFPLAVDEYYFVQSVKAILEHGVPAFETGGYYSRALLVQYLTAASVWLFGDGGFAYRLQAALFSVGTIPLVYLYGRKRLGAIGGLALAIMLSVSAWEIEFGRFARMYAALQFFTVLFFVALDRASDGNDRRWTYAPHLVALVASFVHEFAILLVPFLFVSAIPSPNVFEHGGWWPRFRYLLVTSGVALLCYFIFTTDLRNLGVANQFPPDFMLSLQSPAAASPWRFPILPFFPEGFTEPFLVLVTGLSAAVALAFFVLRRLRTPLEESDLLGALLLIWAAFHQFLIAGLLAMVMVARHDILGKGPGNRRARLMLALGLAIGGCWLAYATASQEWIAVTFSEEYGYSPNYTLLKALIRTFFGWPNVIDTMVFPWRQDLALIGAYALAASVHQLATKGRMEVAAWARHPAVIVMAVAFAFGVHTSDYSSTRYSFFIYPFILALILLSVVEAAAALARTLRKDARFGRGIGAVGCLALFAVSPDFNLRQIIGVGTADVRFRLGEFERYERIWYERWDYESPAAFLNERPGFRDGDKAIVVKQQPVSFYLDVAHAVYYSRTSNLYWDHSRAEGTIDLWSNQPLLSTPTDLQKYTGCARTVWLVRAASPERQPFEIEAVWQERLVHASEVFRSTDNRLAVMRVELARGNGCSS
jgi:hypothetical protein